MFAAAQLIGPYSFARFGMAGKGVKRAGYVYHVHSGLINRSESLSAYLNTDME